MMSLNLNGRKGDKYKIKNRKRTFAMGEKTFYFRLCDKPPETGMSSAVNLMI